MEGQRGNGGCEDEIRKEAGTMTKPELICESEIHPAASLFPLMEGHRFQSLVESIAVHGVQNPIVCSGHVVLDGRNRLRAVMQLRNDGHEIDLPAVQWDRGDKGTTETEWIAAQNLDRRHLSEEAYVTAEAALSRIMRREALASQKASQFTTVKATKAAKARHAVTTKRSSPHNRDRKSSDARSTAGQVAAKAGVSLRKAKQAVKLDQAVADGVLPQEVQKEVIAGKKKLRDAVKEIPAKTKPVKKSPKTKQRSPSCVLDDLRLLLQELLASDRVSKQQILDELTTWIERVNNR